MTDQIRTPRFESTDPTPADLVNSLGIAMLRTTSAGVIVYANRAANDLLGYETQELVGIQLRDLCDDLKKPSSWSQLDGAALWLHTKLGRSIRCVVQSRIHNEDGGQSRCVDLLLVPLNSSEAVGPSESLSRTAMDRSPAGVIITDSNIEIIYSNQAIQTMFGRTDAQLRTMTFTDMMPKETVAEAAAISQQFIRGTLDTGQVETDVFRSDGSTFNVHITASAVRDETGKLLFTISHWVDLTTSRHIAARLARSQATFASAFVDSPAGMSLRDKTFGTIRTNRAMQEMLGNPDRPREGVFSVPEDDTDFWGSVEDIRNGRSTSFSRELRLTDAQGETVWGLCAVSGIQSNGCLAGFLVHFVDVTEQRVARKRLAELAASKDALVRSVSHELRTPLTIIVGLASEMADRAGDFATTERDEFIQMIADQATEMADLVEDLLSAAQSDMGELQVDIVELDIVAVAKHVIDSLITGAVSIDAEPQPLAMGDAFRVRQIVRNLLVNSAKYGQPPYVVAVVSDADHVCLRVIDHGDGVPNSEADAIFLRYYRAHDSSGQPGSVGIGLSLSRQLAELMNGTLTNLRDGDSTVFELLLPRA